MQNYGSSQNRQMDPIVTFFAETKENKVASHEAGRPVYDDIEMVRMQFPADRNRTFVGLAHASAMITQGGKRFRKVNGREVSYAELYREQYQQFKANETPTVRGTPLSEATFLTEGKRKSLRALQFYTIEQLAAADASKIGMGGVEMVEQAKAYLAKADGSADLSKMAAENAAMKAEIDRMRQERIEAARAEPSAPADEFSAMDEGQLKDYIEQKTGVRPHGNTAKATLVSMARDSG